MDPFSNQGRSLQSYKGINANPIYSVNKEQFHQVVLRTAQRLRKGQIFDQTEADSDIEGGDSDDPGSFFEWCIDTKTIFKISTFIWKLVIFISW